MKFNEIDFYDKYKGKITCAYQKDIKVNKETGKEQCYAKRTQEKEKYMFNGLTNDMVLIECPKDIFAIEFETHNNKIGDKKEEVPKEKIKEWVTQTYTNAINHKLDSCIVSHGGTSDYIYICNVQNLIESKEKECKIELAKLIIPKEAIDFLDLSNLGSTLIPIINRPHWKKKKYPDTIHQIKEGKNPDKHKNKLPDIVLQRVFDNERPNFPKIENYGDSDINSIPLSSVVSLVGLKKKGQEYQGSNVWHGSETGMNFCINPSKNTWYCFRCAAGGGVVQAIALNKGIIRSCNEVLSADQFKQVLEIARSEYGLKKPEPKKAKGLGSEEEQVHDDLKTFIFDENEIIQTRVFSSHLLNENLFGFGILLPRTEDILNDQKEIVGQEQKWRAVTITSENRGVCISKWFQQEYKIKFEEIPYEMRLRWELKDIHDFIHSQSKEKIDGKKLFDLIRNQYNHYLYFRSSEWYKVHSLWDLGTYLHQLFSAFPLFENRGLTGTAKTKTMLVSSYITLNGTDIMTNPSEATLFRETESLRPTKYFDEAEKLFKFTKDGMEADNRIELINSSYTRNGSVPRQEKIGSKYYTKWYHTYSPTMISSITGLYGSTENRAITQIHTKAPDNDLRGERDPEDDINLKIWKEIRNNCYRWALENWRIIYDEYLKFGIKTNLKKRDLQIWKPLLVLAKVINEKELLPEIISFAEKLSLQRKNDNLSEGSLDYKYLSCLNYLLINNTSDKIYLDAIRERFNRIYGGNEEKKSNKSISVHLDKMGFKELRLKDRSGSCYQLTKAIFDEIINPLTNDFLEIKEKSSQPSQSSQSLINDNKISDECVMDGDESKNRKKKKCDECDDCDENDESPEQLEENGIVIEKKIEWSESDKQRLEDAKKRGVAE